MYKASKKEFQLTKKIIEEEICKRAIDITYIDLDDIANNALDISYSIGGGFGENTLKQIIVSLIEKKIY